MNEADRFKILRKTLYKEIQGELSYDEKKEFLKERIDERVIAKLHEKYLRRKRYLTASSILYGILLSVILVYMLIITQSKVMISLIILSIALLPLFIGVFFSRAVMGYSKLDLALRLITRFYVTKKIDS
jgi:uncharacterized integral membrane protein